MGTVHNPQALKNTFMYKRAFDKKSRNIIWRRIVSKTNYSVDIIWESEDRDNVAEKETEFIKLYGRRDNNTGILANLTDGGDGSLNPSQATINKMVATNRANGLYERIGKLREGKPQPNPAKGKERPDGYTAFKECFIYNQDGTFYGKFNSIRDGAKSLGMHKSAFGEAILKSKVMRSGKVAFHEYKGENIPPTICSQFKKVYKICPVTGIVQQEFNSSKDSLAYLGVGSNTMSDIIKEKRIYNGFIWAFSSVVNINEYRKSKVVSPRGFRKKECTNCGFPKEESYLNYTYCKSCFSEKAKLSYKLKKNGLK